MIEKKELELNALLEVTQAINANMAEDDLYKIFYFTCISNLKYNKLALIVNEGNWECKVNHRLKINEYDFDFLSNLDFSEKVIVVTQDHEFNAYQDIDFAIPISHKEKKLAVVLIGESDVEIKHDMHDFAFIRTLSNVIMVAIENKRFAREALAKEAIKKEMEIAQNVQSLLFPRNLPDNDGICVSASYFPHTSVGGDYYDYIELSPSEHLICIADVSGKGVPAAMLMSNFQAALRTLARKTSDLMEIVHELNHLLISNSGGGHFVTFFVAIFNSESRLLRYINAGHNPPIVLQNNDKEELNEGTTMLGAFDILPFVNEGAIQLGKGAIVFCYTDGITETRNNDEEEFGEERMEKILLEFADGKLPDLHTQLICELDDFKESQSYHDDLTILSARFF